ncbi:MAG TPA: VOC family protein [bacterium]|nr:VOC family protein [bacterium]
MKKPNLKKSIIDIWVKDLTRALNFYHNILGLSVIQIEKDWISIEAMGIEIHLYLYGGIKSGLEFRVSDIEKEVENLKSKGIKFKIYKNMPNLLRILSDDIMEFPWGKMAFFNDSEGNRLVLVEDL